MKCLSNYRLAPGAVIALLFLIAGSKPVTAQPVPLTSWAGNVHPWEAGTETDESTQDIYPKISALSSDGQSLVAFYPGLVDARRDVIHSLPAEATLPLRDTGLYSFVDADCTAWAEPWPAGPDSHFSSLQIPYSARWVYDFGGLRNLDQRWQWMVSQPDDLGQTRIYEISYTAPTLLATFYGSVDSEPLLYELRGSDPVIGFTTLAAWSIADPVRQVIYDPATGMDTLRFDNTSGILDVAYCSRRPGDSPGTLYGFKHGEEDDHYTLVHHVEGEGDFNRLSVESSQPPRLLTLPFYQRTDLLDPDFTAWVSHRDGHDVIEWARLLYNEGMNTPFVANGGYAVNGQVTRLRAAYHWAHDESSSFDSWFVFWSEYDSVSDSTHLYSMMAYRDSPLGVDEDRVTAPLSFSLASAYPNPFNATTVVPYTLAAPGNVRITVYDLLGRSVALLENRSREAGAHRISWNAGDMPSGTYLVVMQVGENRDVRRVTLVR